MKKRIVLMVVFLAIIFVALGILFSINKKEPLQKEEVHISPKLIHKVAIVVDDWGYNINNIELMRTIDVNLTISILPNLPHSKWIARNQKFFKGIREIILHMPMEPENENLSLESNTLLTAMDKEEVTSLLNEAIDSLPYASGISNHMGSEATKDAKLMSSVMEVLQERKLYFLDSIAVPKTACEKIAKNFEVKFAQRDVFLDNIDDEGYITSQFDKLIEKARKNGSAIGIGHDRHTTLVVLKKKTDELKNSDIEFVFVSDLTTSM
ncbi:divergent polysaccharide deacetylase family protein [Candidatus Omnitrophota bacterium]